LILSPHSFPFFLSAYLCNVMVMVVLSFFLSGYYLVVDDIVHGEGSLYIACRD